MKVKPIMAKFEAYCNPRRNVTWERHVFNTRNQLPGESIDHFVTDLRTKARTCEFGELTDSLIRDRIIEGVNNDGICSRLLREADLPLQKALDICRASEATTTQMKSLTSEHDIPTTGIETIAKNQQQNLEPLRVADVEDNIHNNSALLSVLNVINVDKKSF